MLSFILYKIDTQYYFKLLDSRESGYLLMSQAYTTKQSALNGIRSVKLNGPIAERYSDHVNNGFIWFNLHAANGEIIATSEHFPDTVLGKEKKKKKKKEKCPTVESLTLIEDLT